MMNWVDKFKKLDIFFITPDIKRGLGLEDILPNYHILCSTFDPIIPILRKNGAKIFCLEEKIGKDAYKINNSGTLLGQSLVEEHIKQKSLDTPYIMYFKPSLKLDLLIEKKENKPIGNNALLNEQFENKLLAHKLISENLPRFTINAVIDVLGKLNFANLVKKLGLPFVIQFGHGWAGKTTFFIKKEEEFHNLVKKFANTKVKASQKIEGFPILNNCCIYQGQVLIGPPALQISDIPALYPKPGVTCGRQWPATFLTKKQVVDIAYVSKIVGKLMEKSGFRGFFGLDFLVEESTERIFISEINARLTASASFYTYLEKGLGRVPLLIYHLADFMGIALPKEKEKNAEVRGTQVIFRSLIKNKVSLPSDDFGVFRLEGSIPIIVRKDYSPQNLFDDEFIYLQRIFLNNKVTDEEWARLETKQEALEAPKKLKLWLTALLERPD